MPGNVKLRGLVLGAVLGLVLPGTVFAQNFFNNTDSTAILGSVSIIGTVPVAGTVGVSGTVSTTLSGTPPVAPVQPSASPVDCSRNLSVTPGTAVQVVAAATTRQVLLFHNPTATNIGLSFTSTSPVIGNAQTYTLQPGQTLPFPPAPLTTNAAVWAAGSAASQPLTCTLWN